MKNVVIGALLVITVGAITSDALLYQRYSSSRPLVTINGKSILKKDYQDALDAQTQGGILKKMVFARIVTDAAAKQGVSATEKDVDDRLSAIERRSPQALAGAQQNPVRMAELRDGLKTDIALDNLRLKGVQVTDAEVAAFYAVNKQAFTLPVQVKTTLVVAQNAVDASTASTLLQQGTPTDVVARQPRLRVVGHNGFQVNLQALPPTLAKQISQKIYAMKAGTVQSFALGHVYLIVRADKTLPGGVPSFNVIKPEVTRLVRLQKAPTAGQELATLYHQAHVNFDVDKYAAYFKDVQDSPVSNPGKTVASAN